jgi:hypothetical protein
MGEKTPRPTAEHAKRCRAIADRIIPPMRRVARSHGYALIVHGSLARDIDVLCVPWTADAVSAERLAASLRRVLDRLTAGGRSLSMQQLAVWSNPSGKSFEHGTRPHGRKTWSYYFDRRCAGPYLDMGIMPRAEKSPPKPLTPSNP